MHDAALKEKAREMFVVNGFSMDTIDTLMPEVSRKTLYNWRDEDEWAEQRKSRVTKNRTRTERLEAIVDRLLDELDVTLDPKLIFSMGKIIAALKSSSTFEFTDEKRSEDEKPDELSDETWAKIDERLGLS